MWLKGFENFEQLSAPCPLGTVAMEGPASVGDDPDVITSFVVLKAEQKPEDITVWHGGASRLLEHVRRVMSFASAAVLRCPIIEFLAGNRLEITALSQKYVWLTL